MTHQRISPGLLKDPRHLLSFGFGSGLAPKAPGTFGTLAAIPFYLLLATVLPGTWYVLACVAGFIVGIYLCGYTCKALNAHDHPGIVWDEFIGFFITMIWVPLTPLTVLLGFIFFRIFDILKPWPISVIDSRVKGGFGVMLDDVLAAIYALACMHVFVALYY